MNHSTTCQTNLSGIKLLVEQAVQETGLQDDSIRELAGTLREMLAIANMIPDLRVIPDTTDVIVDISRQSLRVASLIHEYTKLSFPGESHPLPC